MRAQSVADATDRLDVAGRERCVELPSESSHVHLDDVRIAVERIAPDLLKQLGLRHHVAGSLEQRAQHLGLASGELDLHVATTTTPRCGLESQFAVDEHAPRAAGTSCSS